MRMDVAVTQRNCNARPVTRGRNKTIIAAAPSLLTQVQLNSFFSRFMPATMLVNDILN